MKRFWARHFGFPHEPTDGILVELGQDDEIRASFSSRHLKFLIPIRHIPESSDETYSFWTHSIIFSLFCWVWRSSLAAADRQI